MSEYMITYKELETAIDTFINASPDPENLKKYKADILSALTGDYEISRSFDASKIKEIEELWYNQISNPSELLIGTKYVRLQDCIIPLLEAIITGGLADSVISSANTNTSFFSNLSVGTISSVAFAIWNIINDAQKLDDFDFCVFLQASAHYKKHKSFSKDELLSWLPSTNMKNNECNISTLRWDCMHNDDGKCLFSDEKVDNAIRSLQEKGILKIINNDDGTELYKFDI